MLLMTIEDRLDNIKKQLRQGKIETIKVYREQPDTFAVVKPTDLINDFLKDIETLLEIINMKTLQEQYTKILKGDGRKDLFLKEAKHKYPNLISNITSFKMLKLSLKSKSVINEELGGVVTLQPINKLTSEDFNPNKQAWENKFDQFVNEEKAKSLKPIVNIEVEKKENDKAGDEKIKAEEKETAKEVINIQDRNYDYSPKVDNINNVNAQEMMNGVYYEIKENPELSLAEAQEKVIKNLAKDQLHYVKEGQFGAGIGYEESKVEENSGKTYGGSGYSDKLKEGSIRYESN